MKTLGLATASFLLALVQPAWSQSGTNVFAVIFRGEDGGYARLKYATSNQSMAEAAERACRQFNLQEEVIDACKGQKPTGTLKYTKCTGKPKYFSSMQIRDPKPPWNKLYFSCGHATLDEAVKKVSKQCELDLPNAVVSEGSPPAKCRLWAAGLADGSFADVPYFNGPWVSDKNCEGSQRQYEPEWTAAFEKECAETKLQLISRK